MGQAYKNAAAARASGYMGQANAYGGAFAGGMGTLQQLLMMQKLFGGQGDGSNTYQGPFGSYDWNA